MTFTPDPLIIAAKSMAEILFPATLWEQLPPSTQRNCIVAFAAGLRTLADPVSEAVVEAARLAHDRNYGVSDPMGHAITAAIHAIVGKEGE